MRERDKDQNYDMWPRSRKGDQIHVLGTSLNGK